MIFIICIIFVERQDPLQVLAFNHLVVSCVTKPLGDQVITSVWGIDFTVNWIYFSGDPEAKLEGHESEAEIP